MQLTHFLAQLLGLYCVIVAVAMFVRKREMIEIALSLIQDRPLLFIVEIFGLIAGLAMVLGHTVWSKGLLAFIITLMLGDVNKKHRAAILAIGGNRPIRKDNPV